MTIRIKNINSVNAELGKNNDTLHEPENEFLYDVTNSEKVIRGQNNTWIVLGRDRPSDRASGYGGNGTKKAGTIDIVAGRLSSIDATKHTTKRVNPSFTADAARIYISQKTDIDKNFGLTTENLAEAVGNSGIGIKADDVRIIARKTLRFVTATDSKLSNGTDAYVRNGVELIANNDSTDMQPIPKGLNLEFCLQQLQEKVLELNGLMFEFVEIQTAFNRVIGEHTHFSPFYGIPTSPSEQILGSLTNTLVQTGIKVEQGLRNNIVNLKNWESKYLINGSPTYINSSFHSLN